MGKKTIRMTIEQYEQSELNTDALKYNAITKRIREKRSLPNVKNHDTFGRTYVLNVVTDKK